ncbi:LEA type 2 family protein [Stenotrophomonas sp. YIM B06876]|uniref:NDR1/HIN1-like protein n=1 Tax=Stenotrophomonas sp. YIM B06876 TaxID=3060211 RepID=UPI0027396CDA|nr:LEA type 2 family protein [Stenotrophomonas sp. YIM B06876]
MRQFTQYALIALCALALTACGNSTVKRVSEPAASIQQLTVGNDGHWTVELRLRNYSSMPMRFDHVALKITVGDQLAGTLTASPALSIGPESADVVRVELQPASPARLVVADTLAGARALPYELQGEISVTPEARKQRSFPLQSRNTLSPAPGLPGVLR